MMMIMMVPLIVIMVTLGLIITDHFYCYVDEIFLFFFFTTVICQAKCNNSEVYFYPCIYDSCINVLCIYFSSKEIHPASTRQSVVPTFQRRMCVSSKGTEKTQTWV